MQILESNEIDTDEQSGVVYVVDDDPLILEALAELLSSMGRRVVCFAKAKDYIDYHRTDFSACLIVDVMLPDMNGLDLQRQLADDLSPPIVFISGGADVPTVVRAMKSGAIEFLTKPISQAALLVAIEVAFEEDRQRRKKKSERDKLQKCVAKLTPRERQVFELIASGLLNKQAAAELGICEVTLQLHRTQVMRKMEARSFAELVRKAAELGIPCRPVRL